MSKVEMTTLTVAQDIAAILEDNGYAASAVRAETGRIVLSIETIDDDKRVRSFRFLGGEVTR